MKPHPKLFVASVKCVSVVKRFSLSITHILAPKIHTFSYGRSTCLLPSAAYLIVGPGVEPVVKTFEISEQEQCWHQVEYEITD
jgi:hypothetical protein